MEQEIKEIIEEQNCEGYEDKFLSENQMRVMDIHHEKNKIRKLNVKHLELQRMILELKKNLLIKDIQLLEAELANVKTRNSDEQAAHKQWVNQLKEELGIVTDNWGYEPDSGLLHVDSDKD